MDDHEIVLVGRSSSHFTRTARVFAHDLGVPYIFRAVLDMTAIDPATYGDNPALKVPVLIDQQGPLFGTENICRALAVRAGKRDAVVLRGDAAPRLIANAEELILHAMNSEVTIIMNAGPGAERPLPPKVRRSLENALDFLEANVEAVRAALPPARLVSFCEAALFCLVTHLPFRNIMDVTGYARLQAFCREFERRPGALATPYRFDAA
ncbi:MAG TPA: glutathione S-transferase family protein [Polyangia bacterium]|jgi:glutathione S-transferase